MLRQAILRQIQHYAAAVIVYDISGQTEYDTRRLVNGNPIIIDNTSQLTTIITTGTKADVLMNDMPVLTSVSLGTPSALIMSNLPNIEI